MTVSSTRSVSTLGAPAVNSAPDNSLGPQAFMRLLVTQIQNQDPLAPMDTSQMMQQLTQLGEVEQLTSIDGRLENLAIASAGIANAQAADIVGHTVEADTSTVLVVPGAATQGSFQLDNAAAAVRVEVRDGSGNVVRTLDVGARRAGTAGFTWDGRDDAGNPVTPGQFRITVQATDSEGREVVTRTRIRGLASSIRYDNGYPEVRIGEVSVPLGQIRVIEAAPRTTTAAYSSTPSTSTTAAATYAAVAAIPSTPVPLTTP